MKIVAVVIARMGSSRLPGKILFDLAGKPVIHWVVRAARCASLVDDCVVATTTGPKDDVVANWCADNSVPCFRGSEDDVLSRFVGAAKFMEANAAIRLTADCPLLDSNVIDQIVALQDTTGADYVGNIDPPTWPDGLDCEIIRIKALTTAEKEATSKIDRECVSTFITSNRRRFHCETLICPLPGMHKERWVLDTKADYEFCQKISHNLVGKSWLRIKRFLDINPELRKINANHPRNERLYAAMAEEPFRQPSYETSKTLLARAEEIIPLGAQTFSKSKIQYPAETPLFLTHGDGGYCYDVDGNRLVDLVGGLLPVILGHRDPDVDYAVRRQLSNGISFSLATELEQQLAVTLCRLIPCAEMVRFGKNGTDVTTAAVRLARACTGRNHVISSGYHGWNSWCVARDEGRNLGVPYFESRGTHALKHGDTEGLWLHKVAKDTIAAVIVEPETDVEFLRECRKFCDDVGALLIFDEIITGFRFDLGGAQKLFNITPDLACFGKSMANGMPLSAIVGKREYMRTMEKICYSGTFFGEALSLAAAIATIDKLEREDVVRKIARRNLDLYASITKIMQQTLCGMEYEGSNLLPRIKFMNNDIKTLFMQTMIECSVLIIASHNLMYAHGDNEIRRIVRAYEHTLPLLAEAIETRTVQDRIKGRVIPAYANVRAAE